MAEKEKQKDPIGHVSLSLGQMEGKDVIFVVSKEGTDVKRTWFERQTESEFLIMTVEGFLEKGFTVSFN